MNKSFNADDAIGKHLASHPSYSDFLCHHGILGMKWGIRRFQNKDGSLTSEGKKRYSTDGGASKPGSSGNHSDTSSNGQANGVKRIFLQDKTLSAMDKDYFGANSARKSPKDAEAAATLGLKALMKTRPGDSFNPDDKFDHDWFLNEDQTFGLPTAANFVNKGYSAEDIKKFFKAVSENADYDSDYINYFDIMESQYKYYPEKLDEFIDECVSIKNGEAKKNDDERRKKQK